MGTISTEKVRDSGDRWWLYLMPQNYVCLEMVKRVHFKCGCFTTIKKKKKKKAEQQAGQGGWAWGRGGGGGGAGWTAESGWAGEQAGLLRTRGEGRGGQHALRSLEVQAENWDLRSSLSHSLESSLVSWLK